MTVSDRTMTKMTKMTKTTNVVKEVKCWNSISYFITITHCNPKVTLSKDEIIKLFREFVPEYKALAICEEKKPENLHYHVLWDGVEKWGFRRTRWKQLLKVLGASVLNIATWNKSCKVDKDVWLCEKWRYTHNLVNAAFAESKGTDKGHLWHYSDGLEYRSVVKKSKLKPEAQVLQNYIDGIGLTAQYQAADIAQKAYLAKNYQILNQMINEHKRIMRRIAKEKPRFTKNDFILIPEAENHNFKWSLVLMGEAGYGKTQYAKSFFQTPLVVRHMDKLKMFDENYHDGVVFDDMSFAKYKRENVVHIFDTEEDQDINVKNAMITLPPWVPKVFCTNRELRVYKQDRFGEVLLDTDKSFMPPKLDQEQLDAVDRRCHIVHITSDLRKNPPLGGRMYCQSDYEPRAYVPVYRRNKDGTDMGVVKVRETPGNGANSDVTTKKGKPTPKRKRKQPKGKPRKKPKTKKLDDFFSESKKI